MAIQSVLMICMGNICRSPTAEAVFREYAKNAGLEVSVDSAGTIGMHKGSSPDPRSMAAAHNRGYTFNGIYSRKVVEQDFFDFDLILAMDNANYQNLLELCPKQELQNKIKMFLQHSKQEDFIEVPDPYYGGAKGFELVLNLLEDGCEGWINFIISENS